MNTTAQERPCDEIPRMISRSFDRDLDKEEILTLYHHILQCSLCRERMAELVEQEKNLFAAARCYQIFSLPEGFSQQVMTRLSGSRPAEKEKSAAGVGSWWILSWRGLHDAFRHRLMPFAVFGLVVVIGAGALSWLWTGGHFGAVPSRLFVHDVSLQMAKDSVNWNHQQTVPPNYDLYMRVSKRDPQPYFFRLSAAEPVKIFLMHTGDNEKSGKRQELLLTGDRYATLKTPKVNDVVLIRNQGGRPLLVNAYASHPDAITFGIERSLRSTQ